MVVALACRVVQGAVRACTGLCKGGRVAVARALVLAGDAALLQQVDVDVRAAHLVRLVYSTRAVARLLFYFGSTCYGYIHDGSHLSCAPGRTVSR